MEVERLSAKSESCRRNCKEDWKEGLQNDRTNDRQSIDAVVIDRETVA